MSSSLTTCCRRMAMRAGFDDCSAALLERQVGAGKLRIWTSTLHAYWSSFPLEPAYLPFVHQLVRYAAGHAPGRAWHTAGQGHDPHARPAGERVGSTPGGRGGDG